MTSFDDPNFFTNSIFTYDQSHLAPSQDYLSQPRHSISSTSDIFASLSPAASSSSHGFPEPPSLNHTAGSSSQSPRSSASPRSNGFYENSVSDFELDELLNMSSENMEGYEQKSQFVNGQLQMQPQNLFLPNFGNNFGTMGGGPDLGKFQVDQLANMLLQQQQQQQQQQNLQPQHLQQNQQQQTMAPQWMQNQQDVLRQQGQYSQPPQNMFDFQNAMPLPTNVKSESVTPPKSAQARAPARRGPKPKDKDDGSAPLGPSGGKHNKTERRYRQKVQAAQSELRDAVPALRVLYGTSTEEQKRTTDIKLADGSVDGLGEITRPNASAKTTIFVGSKLYIELLQDRVAGLQRKIEELENYRSAVGGQEDLDSWKADFEVREQARREVKAAADRLKREQESEDSEDDDEEEEEVVVKRKKAKKTTKKDDASTAVRTFAAFAMTFSFLPSARDSFTSIPVESGLPMSNPTAGQVISRIPIITAEHASRLLARGLPPASVPHPSTLVEWGWRILVAVVVAIVLGPIFRRLAKMNRSGLSTTIKEAAKYAFRVEGKTDPAVSSYATSIIGQVNEPSTLSRWYTILHLNRTASDSHSLALLALLQPHSSFLATPESIWKQARASITESTPAPLITVLDTPLAEVESHLARLPISSDPLGALADQLGLLRLNDLYTRMFTMLVFASAKSEGPLPTSTKALLENLDSQAIGSELKSSAFEQEIRQTIQGLAKGTASHALGLVLIGLWGIFTGPNPSSQAALATALAGQEMTGQGANLASVSAMLNLLYPGSSTKSLIPSMGASGNALALDRLALICIEYIKLLVASPRIGSLEKADRAEGAKQVQRITTNLRLAITQVELDGVHGQEVTDKTVLLAKERLVGVLSIIGRRARGRVNLKDEDSGLDAETDEL